MKLRIYRDEELLANAAVGLLLSQFQRTIQNRNIFTVCLSGGSTPRLMFTLLAKERFQKQLNWKQIHLFWGDERAVLPSHSESNYRMASEALLRHVPIPEENIHRFRTELLDPEEIVLDYQEQLKQVFELVPNQGRFPQFDLVYLGLGEDGHTASLFPGVDLSPFKKQWVLSVWIPQLNSFRFSLGVEVFNHSKLIAFLVSGKNKSEILRKILDPQSSNRSYPAQNIQPIRGQVLWLADREATQELPKKKWAA